MIFPKKQLKGVTLIELLVVLMVIVVLAGVTITIINPARQRARAQDAAVTNAVSSIAQTIEAIHGIRGAYPTQSEADRLLVEAYITDGFTVTRNNTNCAAAFPNGNCGLRFGNPAIRVGNVDGGVIVYQIPKSGANPIPCIQARMNEDTNRFVAWAPGYGIRTIDTFCNTSTGWTQLTAP